MAEETKNLSAPAADEKADEKAPEKADVKASEKTADKNKDKKAKKSGKPGLGKRMSGFFREYRSELKKVVWYPKDRVLRDTGIAVAALAVCGVIIGCLDLLFTQIILLLGKIG